MAIKIKQHKTGYRLEIDNEEWEFESRKEMEKVLKIFLDLKELNGQLKDRCY